MPLDPHPKPIKRSTRKSKKERSLQYENLEDRLRTYPHLREKLVEVLDAADNKGGVVEADAAEELIVGLVQDLGLLTMQTWAENQKARVSQEFAETHPEAENKGKKTQLDD